MPSLRTRIKKLAYQQIISDSDRDRIFNALDVAEQEPKTDTWSIKEVTDVLEKHGLLEQEQKTDVLDKLRADFVSKCPKSCMSKANCVFSLTYILQIIDKYRNEVSK